MSMASSRLRRFFDLVVDAAAFVSGIVLFFVTVLVCADIVMRYYFNRPIQGALESSEYGLLFLTLLAAAWLARENKHVRMELLIHKLKPATQATVNGITSLVCVLICAVVTYYGVVVVLDRYRTQHRLTTTLEPLSYPLMSVIPVCFFLLVVQFILSARGYFAEAKALKKKSLQDVPVE
jgi:TRAP-type C4-dicarboxylate transport system permease small subunit